MPKVLVTPAPLAGVQAEYLTLLQSAGFEVLFPKKQAQLNEEELLDQLRGIQATLAGSEPYTRRVLAAHPQLRVIARVGVGYDAVDCQAATDHNVAVCITPGTNQDAVAEHTFTLILALAKNLIGQHLGTVAGAGLDLPTCRCGARCSASPAWAGSARRSPSGARLFA